LGCGVLGPGSTGCSGGVGFGVPTGGVVGGCALGCVGELPHPAAVSPTHAAITTIGRQRRE
jgi:hypothetical protein